MAAEKKKPTAAIYARVSTQDQADDELPIESQIHRCQQKAHELGASVVRVFQDAGRSGRNDRRPEFRDCIRFCELYAPDFLVTWSSSRFARNNIDSGLYKRVLDRAGTRLVYCYMDVDRTTDGGWLLDGMLSLWDEYYSRNVAADTTRSIIRNAQNGYRNGGVTPFGYRSAPAPDDPRRRVLEPVPSEVAIVKRIFDMRLGGVGTKQIAAVLVREGVTHRGKSWKRNAVLALLRNRSMVGETVFGRVDRVTGHQRPMSDWIIVQSHQPIIDREVFDAVQNEVDAAGAPGRGSTSHNFVFSGMLKCSECKDAMVLESAKGRRKRYHYYNCRSSFLGTGHASVRTPAAALDEHLLKAICDQILTEDNLRECAEEILRAAAQRKSETNTRLKAIRQQLADIVGRLNAVYDTIETGTRKTLDISLFTDRIRELKATRQSLEVERAALEEELELEMPKPEVGTVAKTFRDVILESKDVPKLRAFLSSFIDGVDLAADSARIRYKPQLFVLGTAASSAVVPSGGKWLPVAGTQGTKTLLVNLPARVRRRRGQGVKVA